MGHDPPGLEYQPDDSALAGFASLMPPAEPKRGIIRTILRLPVLVLSLPFRLLKLVLGLPARLFGRSRSRTES